MVIIMEILESVDVCVNFSMNKEMKELIRVD